MAEAAAAGDAAVRGAIVRAGRFLGIGIANVITVVSPELVVLGAEVAGVGELLVDTIQREVRERVRMLPVERVRIETSILKERAALWGGVALAIARAAKPPGHPVAEGIDCTPMQLSQATIRADKARCLPCGNWPERHAFLPGMR